jgi:hypothetical protein
MRTTYRSATLGAFLALVVTLLSALPAAGQQTRASTQHLRFVHHDVSPRLRDMPLIPPRAERRVIPRRLVFRGQPSVQADPVIQSSTIGPLVSTTSGLNFDGVGQGRGLASLPAPLTMTATPSRNTTKRPIAG